MGTTIVKMIRMSKIVLPGSVKRMSSTARMDTVSAACGTAMETMTAETTATSSVT